MTSPVFRIGLSWIAAVWLALAAPAQAEPLDRIVAVVNQDVILESELDREVQTVIAQLRQRNVNLPPREALERQVLDRLVMQTLQLSLAERTGIKVDEATLNAAVQRIAEENGLTLSQFRDTLAEGGIDFAQFREGLRREITIARLHRRHADSTVSISPQEIDEYLASQRGRDDSAEFLLGHILIATPDNADSAQINAAREQAEQVRQDLLDGADFAQTAAAESAGPTALEGGSLGWRPQGQLPTLFADLVPRMKVGEISQVIQSPGGFHLVKLQDARRGARQVVTQTHARHILIRPNEVVSDNDARLRLATLKSRIENGEKFEDLARANSQDKVSALQGGDLGWASPGMFVPAFEEQIARLQPGELSEPFRSQYGWHLVEVLERREHDSTDEVRRAKAAEIIRSRKAEEALESWLRRMRDDAYVDVRLEE